MKIKDLFEDENLPLKYVCSYCKKVKNDKGEYVDTPPPDPKKYRVSHGICPECAEEFWGKYKKEMKKK